MCRARHQRALRLQRMLPLLAWRSYTWLLHELNDGTGLQLLHRDVTPDNIIVGLDEDVFLIDFGIAKEAPRSSDPKP